MHAVMHEAAVPFRFHAVQLCIMLTAFESTGFRVGIMSVDAEFQSAVAIATRLHIALDWYHNRTPILVPLSRTHQLSRLVASVPRNAMIVA